MDGNGRWAKQRGLLRTEGHKKGLETAQNIISHCMDLGIKYVSLYVFSTENWKRPKSEIDTLFSLAEKFVSQFQSFCDNKIRVVVSGELEGLPKKLIKKIQQIQSLTVNFDKICVNLCINYGGQRDIVQAVNRLCQEGRQVTVENISQNLYNPFIPEPDVIIRTGGQKRLSNFLLFQCAYAELHFCDTLWPDFTNQEFDSIVADYENRIRNFGGIIDDK